MIESRVPSTPWLTCSLLLAGVQDSAAVFPVHITSAVADPLSQHHTCQCTVAQPSDCDAGQQSRASRCYVAQCPIGQVSFSHYPIDCCCTSALRVCSAQVAVRFSPLRSSTATAGARARGRPTLTTRLLTVAPPKSIVRSRAVSPCLQTAPAVPSGPRQTRVNFSTLGIHVETVASTQRSTASLVRSHSPKHSRRSIEP